VKLSIEIIVALLIKLLLDYAYVSFVSPVFDYAGFSYVFALDKYVLGWMLYLTGYLLLYFKRHLYIAEIYLMLFLLFVLPNIVFFSFADKKFIDLLTICTPFFVIMLFTYNWKGDLISVSKGKVAILGVSFIAVFSVILHFYLATGGEMVLNFTDEYAFREKFDTLSTRGIFGYLNNWVAYVFVSVIFSWSLDNKKILIATLSIGVVLMLFALSGHKGVLQSIFLVSFFYVAFQFKERRSLILLGFLSLILLVIILTEYFSNIFVGSLIIRRLLFVPAHLNFVYLEFFSQNEFVYWSNGILSGILDYPYHVRPVELIGQYLGYEYMAANTGFTATGFMHAGYPGVLIYTLIATVLLNIINALGKSTHKYFVMSLTFIPLSILFRSSDLLTAILTHGIVVSIVALWLYSNKEYFLKVGGRTVYKI